MYDRFSTTPNAFVYTIRIPIVRLLRGAVVICYEILQHIEKTSIIIASLPAVRHHINCSRRHTTQKTYTAHSIFYICTRKFSKRSQIVVVVERGKSPQYSFRGFRNLKHNAALVRCVPTAV